MSQGNYYTQFLYNSARKGVCHLPTNSWDLQQCNDMNQAAVSNGDRDYKLIKLDSSINRSGNLHAIEQCEIFQMGGRVKMPNLRETPNPARYTWYQRGDFMPDLVMHK